MKKVSLLFVLVSIVSSVSFAKYIASMELICVETQKQETVRSLYLTDDKTLLIADPVSHLLMADSVKEVSQGVFLIESQTQDGQESLQLSNSGEAVLTIASKAGTVKMQMKCYSGNKAANLDLSFLK